MDYIVEDEGPGNCDVCGIPYQDSDMVIATAGPSGEWEGGWAHPVCLGEDMN